METFHKNWKIEKLGNNICEKGYACMEIDESSIIGNNTKVYWMFGIIDHHSKDVRVFTILNDRTKK